MNYLFQKKHHFYKNGAFVLRLHPQNDKLFIEILT